MSRYTLRAFGLALAMLFAVAAIPAFAATQPTLFSITSNTPQISTGAVQKSWAIKVNEESAFDAIFQGGMWLPNPSGGRIYAKYQRHIIHANGNWTWIGEVSTVHGEQPAVLTFGKNGVFGEIPQAQGCPLRIFSDANGTRVIATSAQALARSPEQLRLHSKPDYFIPPRLASKSGANTYSSSSVHAAGEAAVQTNSSGPVTIDVMVAYTSGFASMLGSQSLALTRIQYLVDLTNQAYVSSAVNQQIQLVDTVEVNYPDDTSNQSALDDITGIDEKGNPVTIPASLQGIASLRVKYGADLVTLIRSFNDTTQENCGVAWLIGANQSAIVPSQAKVYGYNVVSDGTSTNSSGKSVYCLDTTYAHELGHNMGDAHDRGNATNPDGSPAQGAYSYSYGYLGTGTGGGFSTIMAYGTATDTYLSVFSNPNISTCLNSPCGVADNLTSSSADNAHSMNNTASLIAQFESTYVAHNDVNGDGKSDLLWFNPSPDRLSWWIMNGATMTSHPVQPAATGWKVVATGDFNGDGKADIVWMDAANNVYIWLSNGNGFTSKLVSQVASSWKLVGSGDFNGDGKSDLVWYNPSPSRISWWLMNGTTISAHPAQPVTSGWRVVGTGDFYGDGTSEIVWEDAANSVYFWRLSGATFASTYVSTVSNGWTVVGTADVNGDGNADLLWYNPSPARLSWWLMNGPSILSHPAQSVSSAWHVSSTGDFNGDGKSEVVWTDTNNNVYFWSLSGSSFSSQLVGNVSPGWSLVP